MNKKQRVYNFLENLTDATLEFETSNKQQTVNSDLGAVSGSTIDWDKFANALKDEFGESLVEEDGGEEDAYNWWLTDVTVTDIVEFVKNYH